MANYSGLMVQLMCCCLLKWEISAEPNAQTQVWANLYFFLVTDFSKGLITSAWWSGEQSSKRSPVRAKPSGALHKMDRPNRNSVKGLATQDSGS